jgi:hypothetical protein
MLAGMDSEREIPSLHAEPNETPAGAGGIGDTWFMLLVGIGLGVILSLMVFAFR